MEPAAPAPIRCTSPRGLTAKKTASCARVARPDRGRAALGIRVVRLPSLGRPCYKGLSVSYRTPEGDLIGKLLTVPPTPEVGLTCPLPFRRVSSARIGVQGVPFFVGDR